MWFVEQQFFFTVQLFVRTTPRILRIQPVNASTFYQFTLLACRVNGLIQVRAILTALVSLLTLAALTSPVRACCDQARLDDVRCCSSTQNPSRCSEQGSPSDPDVHRVSLAESPVAAAACPISTQHSACKACDDRSLCGDCSGCIGCTRCPCSSKLPLDAGSPDAGLRMLLQEFARAATLPRDASPLLADREHCMTLRVSTPSPRLRDVGSSARSPILTV